MFTRKCITLVLRRPSRGHLVTSKAPKCFFSASSDPPSGSNITRPRTSNTDERKPSAKSILDDVDRIMKERETRKSHEAISFSAPTNETQQEVSIDDPFFEVFSLPKEESSPRHPDAWDKEACQAYLDEINPIMETDPKFRRLHTSKPIPLEVAQPVMDWLRAERPMVKYEFPCWEQAMREGTIDIENNLSLQVQSQRDFFCQEMHFDKGQWTMLKGALFQVTNKCAKHAIGAAVPVLWQKILEAGIADKNLLQHLLYVSSTFAHNGNRRKRTRYAKLVGLSLLDVLDAAEDKIDDNEDVNDDDLLDTTDEIAYYHDLLHDPTEQSVNVRVKLLVAQGKAKEAEALLDEHSTDAELRLRGYAPVLRLYLELKDFGAALALYRRMRETPLVHLDVETYMHVLVGLAQNGCFAPNASKIPNASSGPVLLDELASQMAEEIIEIPTASAKRLYNAFAEGFPESNLVATTSMEPLKLAEDKAGEKEVVANRVRIDHATGLCPRSGATLRLIRLVDEEREQLKQSLLDLARQKQVEFLNKMAKGKNKRANKENRADDGLQDFLKALDTRSGEPFTAIVDGPNVGYYMQNFESGRFSFHQIQFVVESLESMGEQPLVVLPQKYTRPHFFATIGFAGGSDQPLRQRLTPEEIAIRDSLVRSGKVYVVPHGILDDFYWILASIAPQTKACNGESLDVPTDNREGRWPGARPVLISNDQMRDHKMGMMEPMLFRRWYSNFIVNYNFAPFVEGHCTHPEIVFQSADAVSREIQGNVTDDGPMAWHFPIQDTEDEWFCIRVPRE